MPLIHIGDRTHHHDQVMMPVSLSAMNVISAIQPMSPGILRCRAFRVGSFTRIMLNTLPGYGAGLELRYGGLAVNDTPMARLPVVRQACPQAVGQVVYDVRGGAGQRFA
jgi:hypothetical protein